MVSALGTPRWLVEECHAVGTKVMSMVGAVRHAPRLEQMGVDIIVAQGTEAGGHVGTVTTMVLVPSVVDAVSVPVLAAGGIIDGRGIAAGMMLGAQGAWIGTRFIATEEATAPDAHKQGILNADENGTVVSRCYTGKPSRVLKNEFTSRWHGRDNELLPMPWQRMRVEKLVPGQVGWDARNCQFPDWASGGCHQRHAEGGRRLPENDQRDRGSNGPMSTEFLRQPIEKSEKCKTSSSPSRSSSAVAGINSISSAGMSMGSILRPSATSTISRNYR